jgi:chromosome segregation ATPase
MSIELTTEIQEELDKLEIAPKQIEEQIQDARAKFDEILGKLEQQNKILAQLIESMQNEKPYGEEI